MKLYEEIANFIAKTAGPEKLAAFRPSKAASRRVEVLVQKHKEGEITKMERAELDHCLQIEHMMRMAKARARLRPVSA
jgi:hypothetical protein